MEIKETMFRTELHTTLINNDDYFKYIFKKTEKIVCAVLYTVRSNTDIRQGDPLVTDLETVALRLMDVAQATLTVTSGSRARSLSKLRAALIVLESRLNMVSAAGLLSRDLLEVFKQELYTLGRGLKRYLDTDEQPSFEDSPVAHKEVRREMYRKEKTHTLVAPSPHVVQTENRRDRILEVIRDKQNATIKDISEVVTDCSEKTIQRELIELIKDGTIVREGERRWSKYKLV